VFRDQAASEAEVTNFEVAIAVEKDIGGLKVAVDDLRAVQELDALHDLVDDEAVVDVLEDLLTE
jgi:hypothetical protein